MTIEMSLLSANILPRISKGSLVMVFLLLLTSSLGKVRFAEESS